MLIYAAYTLKGTVIPANSRIITSDDVFDFMLNLRMLNEGIDLGREELFEEYRKIKSGDNGKFRLRSLDDFEELKRLTSVKAQYAVDVCKKTSALMYGNNPTAKALLCILRRN